MSNKLSLYVIFISLFWSSLCQARSCDSNEKDKAEYFAEKAGHKIISKYGGGQDKRVNLSSCEYNSYSEEFNLKIEIYWNGSMFRDNNYNVDGVLKLKSDGSESNFSQTYANQNVEDLSFFKNVVTGALVLGALSSDQSSSSSSYSSSYNSEQASSASSGARLKFTNSCNQSLRLLVNYKNMDDEWVTEGMWEFAPNESSYLTSNGVYLRTNNPFIYYYVRSSNDYLGSNGEYEKTFEGKTYHMRRIEDKYGDTEWSVSC